MKNELFSAFGLGVGVIAKLLLGLWITKLCATYLGVEEFWVAGQVSNLMALIGLLAGAGVSVGVARHLSVTNDGSEHATNWVGNANSIVTFFVILIFFVGGLLNKPIINWLFNGELRYSFLFWLMLFAALPLGFSAVFQGVITGLLRSDLYAIAMVIGSILSVVSVSSVIYFGIGLKDIILSTLLMPAIFQSAIIIFIGFWLLRSAHPSKEAIALRLEPREIKILLAYGLLNITAGLLVPSAYLFVRAKLLGVEPGAAVGMWQGLLRLSDAYTQLPILLLTTYVLPKFSSTKSFSSHQSDMIKLYLKYAALVGIILLFIFFFGNWIVVQVFTTAFEPMLAFLPYQLWGDFFRLMAYLGTTLMAALGFVRVCFGFELIQSAMLFIIGYYVPKLPGVYGVVVSYAGSYFCYFLLSVAVLALLWKSNETDSIGTRD